MERTRYEISYTKGTERLVDCVATAAAAINHRDNLRYNGCRDVEAVRVLDLGTVRRDQHGRFTKIYTLSYEVPGHDGLTVRQVRRLPAEDVVRIGTVANRVATRNPEKLWNIAVLNSRGEDITSEFECFA